MLFVLILLNLIFITSTNGSWHQLDGIEYYIEYTAVIGVDKAKEGCKGMNAILAVVKSQRIQDLLVKNIDITKLTGQPYSFYIGLSRTSPITLQWSDGTTTDTSVFTYWDCSDDIYDSSKLCVTMGWDGGLNGFKWKIEYCNGKHRSICQRNIATTAKAPTTSTLTTTLLKITSTAIATEQTVTSEVSLVSIQQSTESKPTTNNNFDTLERCS
ncbi:C-type lectin domain family 6 member A-like [Ciona intestinalis]